MEMPKLGADDRRPLEIINFLLSASFLSPKHEFDELLIVLVICNLKFGRRKQEALVVEELSFGEHLVMLGELHYHLGILDFCIVMTSLKISPLAPCNGGLIDAGDAHCGEIKHMKTMISTCPLNPVLG